MPPRATKQSPAETFDAIMDRAERRGRVVLEVEVDGVRVTLAPPAPRATEPVADTSPSDPPPRNDAVAGVMDDPATFGLPPGAPLPGFRRPRPEESS